MDGKARFSRARKLDAVRNSRDRKRAVFIKFWKTARKFPYKRWLFAGRGVKRRYVFCLVEKRCFPAAFGRSKFHGYQTSERSSFNSKNLMFGGFCTFYLQFELNLNAFWLNFFIQNQLLAFKSHHWMDE